MHGYHANQIAVSRLGAIPAQTRLNEERYKTRACGATVRTVMGQKRTLRPSAIDVCFALKSGRNRRSLPSSAMCQWTKSLTSLDHALL
jgi:hypothetical protein